MYHGSFSTQGGQAKAKMKRPVLCRPWRKFKAPPSPSPRPGEGTTHVPWLIVTPPAATSVGRQGRVRGEANIGIPRGPSIVGRPALPVGSLSWRREGGRFRGFPFRLRSGRETGVNLAKVSRREQMQGKGRAR